LAVAAIPLAAGITGDSYRDPAAFSDGFRTAMWISAGLAVAGAVLAWVTLAPGKKPQRPVDQHNYTHCPLVSPPPTVDAATTP
jgi:hypothetical protein